MLSEIPTETRGFDDPQAHLTAELQWLDLLLGRAIRNLAGAASDNPGVYVTDAEAARLVDSSPRSFDTSDDAADDAGIRMLRDEIDDAVRRSRVRLPLPDLVRRVGLTSVEALALIICLAPELDRKYDKVYAYLQDDITRKRPSVDLVVSLLAPEGPARWRLLRLFSPHAPLRRFGLIREVPDRYSMSGSTALAQMLCMTPRFVAHALGDDYLDAALVGRARLVEARLGPSPADLGEALQSQLVTLLHDGRPLLIHLQGDCVVSREELAHAVAAAMGRRELLEVAPTFRDADQQHGQAALAQHVEAALREGWLRGIPVLFVGEHPWAEAAFVTALDEALGTYPAQVFVTGAEEWPADRRLGNAGVHQVVVPPADRMARGAAWAEALRRAELSAPPELADRFRLSPSQIRAAVADVVRSAGGRPPHRVHWYAACKRASGNGLAALATRVAQLPDRTQLLVGAEQDRQLSALCDQVRHRETVLDEWGMGARFANAGGLSALFVGPPGTGKTMAAGVVAGELGLDLYRVDLSRVVSKYIGETEKNLAAIFDAAEASNAVLFFDEADALFGKRTKVSDAHDRYANIETSYLLQRMEEYRGISVLATNLRQNMDEAFTRRLRFIVEFPFPDRAQRLRIWQAHLATGAPVATELDQRTVGLLADRLPLSGGSIRNVVLSAAFLAAGRSGPIGVSEVLEAAKSEFAKSGALWPELTREQLTVGEVAV